MYKIFTLFVASAILIQDATSLGRAGIGGFGYNNGFSFGNGGNGFGIGGNGFGCGIPTSGGGLPITSSSPIAPTGLAVSSDNVIDGALAVSGSLPFLGTVALDGKVPAEGQGSVAYECGSGNIGITTASGLPNRGLGFGLNRGFVGDF